MTAMEGFFDAGPLDSFPRGRGRVVLIENVRVAVFRLETGWFALKDSCPHMGSSLADGRIRGDRVNCRWHAWSFDLATGESDSKRKACARVYEDLHLGADRERRQRDPQPSERLDDQEGSDE